MNLIERFTWHETLQQKVIQTLYSLAECTCVSKPFIEFDNFASKNTACVDADIRNKNCWNAKQRPAGLISLRAWWSGQQCLVRGELGVQRPLQLAPAWIRGQAVRKNGSRAIVAGPTPG
jgi:hypothetical protein